MILPILRSGYIPCIINILTVSSYPSLLQRLFILPRLPSRTGIPIITCHTGDQCHSQAKHLHRSISLLKKNKSQGIESSVSMRLILTVGSPHIRVLHPLLLWLEKAINCQSLILNSEVISILSASFQYPIHGTAEEIGLVSHFLGEKKWWTRRSRHLSSKTHSYSKNCRSLEPERYLDQGQSKNSNPGCLTHSHHFCASFPSWKTSSPKRPYYRFLYCC